MIGTEDTRFKVFGKTFRLEALLNLLLREIRESALRDGVLFSSIHVGRPVRYEGSRDNRGELGESRMSRALENAGYPRPVFMEEPVGAAWSYMEEHTMREGETLLVFDFGGGTLDLAVLKNQEGVHKVMSTRGLARAGDWIDREIFKSIVFPLPEHCGRPCYGGFLFINFDNGQMYSEILQPEFQPQEQ